MSVTENHLLEYLQSMCTTEGSIEEDGTWILLIQDDQPLGHTNFERLKNAVKTITKDPVKNLINFKFKENIEFIFTKGKIFVGQKEFDKNETNFKLRNLDDVIYPDKKERISLGWKDAVDAMFQGAKEVCEDKNLYKFLEYKYKYFLDAMQGLQDNDGIHSMFGVKAYNWECFHSICRQYWNESQNKNFLKLKEILADDCRPVCLFYKKGLVEIQNGENIQDGLFAKPLQFTEAYAEKLNGKPYTYHWKQLVIVGSGNEKFPQCVELPHFVNLYDSENKRFTMKNVVYCRVKPLGIYISGSTQMRVMTKMKEILYDDKYEDADIKLDVGNDYKPLSSYNLNKEFGEPSSKKLKSDSVG